MKKHSSISLVLFFAGLFFQTLNLSAQTTTEKPDFTDLNILKLNVTAPFINEVRLSYERGTGPKASLEFSAGFVYPNKLIYDNAIPDDAYLSKGASGEVAFRKYFDKKRYIFQPVFRSYLSWALSYKFTSYDSTWIIFNGATPAEDECSLRAKTFNQAGFKILFGVQKRSGKFVIDFYGGLGLGMVISGTNTIAKNPPGGGCEIIPGTTQFLNQEATEIDFSPMVHFGIKIGLRFHKKEKDDL